MNEKLSEILNRSMNSVITSQQITDAGFHRRVLSELVDENILKKNQPRNLCSFGFMGG